MDDDNVKIETATLAAGCFWCVEAIYIQLKGVISVQSGFIGGTTPNPTYREVCTGNTNHAEVCQITYNADVISYRDLLKVFWSIHDPTTLNRQGMDIGTQYRSAVFFHNKEQEKIATEVKNELQNSDKFKSKIIVTEITEAGTFYPAEDYHNNYLEQNPNDPYCRTIIKPKVLKFKTDFESFIK